MLGCGRKVDDWPAGLPDPHVVQAATEAIGGHFVLGESVSHPVVVNQGIELAYLLSAYGLVASEPERTATSECSDRSRSTLATGRRNRPPDA
jgi:hypothetical protein